MTTVDDAVETETATGNDPWLAPMNASLTLDHPYLRGNPLLEQVAITPAPAVGTQALILYPETSSGRVRNMNDTTWHGMRRTLYDRYPALTAEPITSTAALEEGRRYFGVAVDPMGEAQMIEFRYREGEAPDFASMVYVVEAVEDVRQGVRTVANIPHRFRARPWMCPPEGEPHGVYGLSLNRVGDTTANYYVTWEGATFLAENPGRSGGIVPINGPVVPGRRYQVWRDGVEPVDVVAEGEALTMPDGVLATHWFEIMDPDQWWPDERPWLRWVRPTAMYASGWYDYDHLLVMSVERAEDRHLLGHIRQVRDAVHTVRGAGFGSSLWDGNAWAGVLDMGPSRHRVFPGGPTNPASVASGRMAGAAVCPNRGARGMVYLIVTDDGEVMLARWRDGGFTQTSAWLPVADADGAPVDADPDPIPSGQVSLWFHSWWTERDAVVPTPPVLPTVEEVEALVAQYARRWSVLNSRLVESARDSGWCSEFESSVVPLGFHGRQERADSVPLDLIPEAPQAAPPARQDMAYRFLVSATIDVESTDVPTHIDDAVSDWHGVDRDLITTYEIHSMEWRADVTVQVTMHGKNSEVLWDAIESEHVEQALREARADDFTLVDWSVNECLDTDQDEDDEDAEDFDD